MSFIFKNYSLMEVIYLLIRFSETNFFPRNTKNTDRNGVNKQNTHTHTHTHTRTPNTQRKIRLVSMKINDTLFFKTPPILPAPPFLWEKSEHHPFFFAKIEKTQPSPCSKSTIKTLN